MRTSDVHLIEELLEKLRAVVEGGYYFTESDRKRTLEHIEIAMKALEKELERLAGIRTRTKLSRRKAKHKETLT